MSRTSDAQAVFTSASAALASIKADVTEQEFLFVAKGGPRQNVKLWVGITRYPNRYYDDVMARHKERPKVYSVPNKYEWSLKVVDKTRKDGRHTSFMPWGSYYKDLNRLKADLKPFLSRIESEKVAHSLLSGDSFKETTMDAKKTWALTQDMMLGQFGQAYVLDDATKLEISTRIRRLMLTDGFPDVGSLNAGISTIPVGEKEANGGFSYKSGKGRINVEYSWSFFLGRGGGLVTVTRPLPDGKMNTASKTFHNPKDIGGIIRSLERYVMLDSVPAGLTADAEPVQVWTVDFSGRQPVLVKDAKDAEWGVYEPNELVKIERRRDALWRKEDDGRLTAAEKSELADLQKKLEKHYAKLKADRKKAGFKDAKDADADLGNPYKGKRFKAKPGGGVKEGVIVEVREITPEYVFLKMTMPDGSTKLPVLSPGGYSSVESFLRSFVETRDAKDAKDPKQMTEQEIIEEIRRVQGKDIARSHALRQELDRRWAAGEKAHGIKGGFGKDAKDEMSIVGDMLNGKFAEDGIPMNAVSVRGEDYYAFNSGHRPSGKGNWWFKIGTKEFQFYGYYTDAKKAAIREAARLGEYSVTVLP